MNGIELKELIAGFGLPYAYYQFTKDTAKPPPFICYYLAQSDDFAADGVNYAKIRQLVIELYTRYKDFELEFVDLCLKKFNYQNCNDADNEEKKNVFEIIQLNNVYTYGSSQLSHRGVCRK